MSIHACRIYSYRHNTRPNADQMWLCRSSPLDVSLSLIKWTFIFIWEGFTGLIRRQTGRNKEPDRSSVVSGFTTELSVRHLRQSVPKMCRPSQALLYHSETSNCHVKPYVDIQHPVLAGMEICGQKVFLSSTSVQSCRVSPRSRSVSQPKQAVTLLNGNSHVKYFIRCFESCNDVQLFACSI